MMIESIETIILDYNIIPLLDFVSLLMIIFSVCGYTYIISTKNEILFPVVLDQIILSNGVEQTKQTH
jgi:hypothetical protein